jgi:hypothetical protein
LISHNGIRWNFYPRAVRGLGFQSVAASARFGTGAVRVITTGHPVSLIF